MIVTIRRSFSHGPELLHMTWPEVVNLYRAWAEVPMQGPAPTEKPSDLPLIAFGAFDQTDPKGIGCRRGNLNPRGLWCLAYDFDDAHPDVFADARAKAKALTSHGLVHTTWKHGLAPEGIRARIVMPCYEPGQAPPGSDGHVKPEAWEALWWGVACAIGAAQAPGAMRMLSGDCAPGCEPAPGSGLDTQCRNVERLYYLPARNMASPFACHVEAWGE